MASWINRGESVFFQFRNGKSVLNSQCKPRMFKTAEKATLGVNYVDTDDIVEYTEQKHGRWGKPAKVDADNVGYNCSECGEFGAPCWNYCPNCGAKMDGDSHGNVEM